MDPPIKPGSDEPEGKYSDYFVIGFNAYTIILEFGMTSAEGLSRIHSRVVTSPAGAQDLNVALTETLREHVEKFGPIKKEAKHERLHRYPGGH